MKKLIIAGLVLLITLGSTSPAQAADFNKNLLIDDGLFTDHNSMSVAEIQAFLDDNGSLLANWVDNVDMRRPSDNCVVHKATGMTAAEIIYEASTSWNAQIVENCSGTNVSYWGDADYSNYTMPTVSPKVLLVTLQKEQSLISANGTYSTNPNDYKDPACCSSNEYKLARATGYGVPDSGSINEKYLGFYNQINWASWQFRYNFERSAGNTDWDEVGYKVYTGPMTEGTWRQCASCSPIEFDGYYPIDGSPLYMGNRATASLYYYTPHTYPGFFGNYNFVQFYSDWFGSTLNNYNIRVVGAGITTSPNPSTPGVNVTAEFTVKNYENFEVTFNGKLRLNVRKPNGTRADFVAEENMTIPSKATYTYSQTRSFDSVGEYEFWIASYREGYGWSNYYPKNTNSDVERRITHTVRAPNIKVVAGGLSTVQNPTAPGMDVTTEFTVKNYETFPVTFNGQIRANVRKPNGTRMDFPSESGMTIPGKGVYTYSHTQTFDDLGNYDIWIAGWLPGKGWSNWYPTNTNSDIIRQVEHTVKLPNLRIVDSGIKFTPSPSSPSGTVTGEFTIKNYDTYPTDYNSQIKISVRGPSGNRYDLPIEENFSVNAKGLYAYSQTQELPIAGEYDVWIYFLQPEYGWTKVWPKGTNSSVVKEIIHTVSP